MGGIANLFKAPKIPEPEKAPEPPLDEETVAGADTDELFRRSRAGRLSTRSTFLAKAEDAGLTATPAPKTLLGS